MLSRTKASVFWILVVLSTILVVSSRSQVMAEPTLEMILTATLGSAIEPYMYATPCARAQNTSSWYQTGISGINLIFAGSEGVPPEDSVDQHASATGMFDLLIFSPDGTVGYSPPLQIDGDYPPIKLWSDDSYWYMKIKDNPKLHPDNDKMIDWLMDYHSDRPYINWAGWTNTVYDCYEDTPVYHILDTDDGKYYDVPFPDPYPIEIPPDTDASVTIIDWYRGNVWDLWHVEATGGTYRVGDHMTLDLGGDGLWPAGGSWGSGGSGTATVAFLIRPEEIEAGVINHALGCCMKTAPGGKYTTMTGKFVSPPAAHTDRGNLAGNAIPEGARIQLDPAIDLDSLGLSSTGKIIAKAMQDYGIVAAEAGGNWAIYAEHDLSANWNPPSMSGTLLNPIADLVTDSYNPWRVIDFDLYPTVDDLSEYE